MRRSRGLVATGVALVLGAGAFDAEGHDSNPASAMFKQIGAVMAPDDAPPVKPAAS